MTMKTLCAALLILPAIASAGVNPKNGNFYITFQEITQESGNHDLNLHRVYNSKSVDIGWFGYGWGTPFETRMVVMPDATVAVKENGTGQINYYAPKGGGNIQAGVDKIVSVVSQHDKIAPEAAEALRKDLLADENLRLAKVSKYGIQTQLPEGAIAQSRDCPDSTITRINEEYKRTACKQGTDYFDLAGHLIRQEDDGYKLTIHYAGKYPDRIENSLGQKLFLKWTADGHVAEARTDKTEPVIIYTYDEKHNLLLSNQIEGNFYKYEYDANHNMTKIGYIDNTHMDMQYGENGLITSVTETDGSKCTYTYRTDPKNPSSHYWTTITRISATGEQRSREQEFLLTSDAAGVEQLASVSTSEGRSKQDIIFDEQGRIKRVNRPDGGFSEYTYHPTLNKISAVVTDEGKTVFRYNAAGNLIRAKNSHGQLLRLSYDGKNRIRRMIETNKLEHKRRKLTFKYNSQNRISQIRLIGKGVIKVEYDQAGEIAKVESKQGARMALEVTMAFQTLLSVVKVAGVNLSM